MRWSGSSRCHSSLRKVALPGIRTFTVASLMSSFSLFSIKAMPADAVGFAGTSEFKIIILLSKTVLICAVVSSLRWVSCRAKIAICFVCNIFSTDVHFGIGPEPVLCDERPLILKEAIIRFARYFLLGKGSPWAPVGRRWVRW